MFYKYVGYNLASYIMYVMESPTKSTVVTLFAPVAALRCAVRFASMRHDLARENGASEHSRGFQHHCDHGRIASGSVLFVPGILLSLKMS